MDKKAIKISFKQNVLAKIGLYNKLFVYWWTPQRADGLENYGDIITPYIISKLTRKKIFHVFDPMIEKFSVYYNHYFVIGSVIRFVNSKSIVWGSGIIKSDDVIDKCKIIAVRGPRTGKRLEELGIKDPAEYQS